MPVLCQRRGCGQRFDEETNSNTACCFHTGLPDFHDGLKGWNCCEKRVTQFDEFLAIRGCTYGRHTTEKPAGPILPTKPDVSSSLTESVSPSPSPQPQLIPASFATALKPKVAPAAAKTPAPAAPVEIEEDPVDAVVAPGTKCKRRGCNHEYVDEATSRGGNGSGSSECLFHPGEPIFHEGSKSYSCCKRKVLEFDEFLKIKGCQKGNHLFVGNPKKAASAETNGSANGTASTVSCRHDWYQSQSSVTLAIYAKRIDKQRSIVRYETDSVYVKLFLPNDAVYETTLPLSQEIVPSGCSHEFLSTKAEIILAKSNGLTWLTLRPDDAVTHIPTFGGQDAAIA
ncbi:chord-domain-containing protein [Ramicandelaber brevisporus]|nr:chord-domain-containing protein [Ramicandelaber brevisporus]